MNTDKALALVKAEFEEASSKFAKFNSAHEGYAVILEELDELWDEVKTNPKNIIYSSDNDFEVITGPAPNIREWQERKHKYNMKKEAIQVAAMAIRFLVDICDDE